MWSQELSKKHTLNFEKYKPMKIKIVKGGKRNTVN